MPTPAEIKKALLQAGFEIYRTRVDAVQVAERVRENLLMDSGIVVSAEPLRVGFVVRAQRNDFPGAAESQLFERARGLAESAIARGYAEGGTNIRHVRDPGDEERTLDTWCEIQFEKPVASLELAVSEVGFALSLEKTVLPR
ncbi:hypothetical protein SOCEGT47_026820 [Sorangium cellulosum]|jgi:hypothetical protein|uniref:Uncharacterized protein n=1 Tax=Sorangium cellulosum TaxID=56 RepID=A0A4P2PZL6_SORCE|nr:hypothetical protein [Sorangium cellulosum]AUX22181.1 hypothetical protein SOCEGT47_026820 [Sorangium cellulosum]